MRKEGITWLVKILSFTFQLGLLKLDQGTGLCLLKAWSKHPAAGWMERISITSFLRFVFFFLTKS